MYNVRRLRRGPPPDLYPWCSSCPAPSIDMVALAEQLLGPASLTPVPRPCADCEREWVAQGGTHQTYLAAFPLEYADTGHSHSICAQHQRKEQDGYTLSTARAGS